jgi:hypothetical protein
VEKDKVFVGRREGAGADARTTAGEDAGATHRERRAVPSDAVEKDEMLVSVAS